MCDCRRKIEAYYRIKRDREGIFGWEWPGRKYLIYFLTRGSFKCLSTILILLMKKVKHTYLRIRNNIINLRDLSVTSQHNFK